MTRSEAIGHLKNIAIYSFQDGYTDEARQALDMAIKALEQTGRKKGEWIDKKYRWIKSISMWWHSAYKCSICGETGLKDWNYCPNCGADMRGESDE